MRNKTVLLTGGHLSPLLAIIETIQSQRIDWRLVVVGRATDFESDDQESRESTVIRQQGVEFVPLITGRFSRSLSVQSLVSLVKIPIGLLYGFLYVVRYRPAVIVSFGGYVSVPIVLAGRLCGIPSISHEQTQTAGLANRLASLMGTRTYVAFGAALDSDRVIGPLLRPGLEKTPKHPSFEIASGKKILYITGGTTGSESINQVLFDLLPTLLESYTVIHQTGERSIIRAQKMYETLPSMLQTRYIAASYFDTGDVAWILAHAWCLIGRSGANTVAEAMKSGVVAIYVPLPWSAGDEQRLNAQFAQSHAGSLIIDQSEFTGEKLLSVVSDIHASYDALHRHAMQARSRIPTDGSLRFVQKISAVVE